MIESERSALPSDGDDAALDKILGAEQETNDFGEPVKKAETPGAEEEGSKADEEASAEGEPTDGLEDAITVLRRDKIPMSVIKKMANKEIIALAAERKDAQAKIDNEFRELGELRKKESEARSKAKEEESRGTAAPAEQPSSAFDIARLVEPFSKAFQDPDTVAAYGQGLKGVYEAALNQARAEVAEKEKAIAPLFDAVRELLFRSAEQGLRERFPGLSDKKKSAETRKHTSALMATGQYESLEDAMEVASRVVFGVPVDAAEAAKRNGGQLMTTSRRVSSRPKTQSEVEDVALDVILSGGSRMDAEKALRGG